MSPVRPFGPLERVLRFALAWMVFAPTATLVLLAAPFLLPWRGVRVRLSYRAMNAIGPAVFAALGIPLDARPPRELEPLTPAIFVINHSSSLDTPLTISWLPPGTCGVAKKEALYVPIFGQAYWLSGHLLLDRKNPERARASMDRLVAVMKRHRLGVVMSPEGTRSADGRLKAFKKGFAHIALATRLPVVPIVITGAQHAWPARTLRLAPQPVRLRALAPIPTDDWRPETLDEHVQQVWQVLADALPEDQKPLPAE